MVESGGSGFKLIISLPEFLKAIGITPNASQKKADPKHEEKPKASDNGDESKTE